MLTVVARLLPRVRGFAAPSVNYIFLPAQAPHLGLQVPHLALQAPHFCIVPLAPHF